MAAILFDQLLSAGQPVLAVAFLILASWLLFRTRFRRRKPLLGVEAPPDRLAAAFQPLRAPSGDEGDERMASLTAAWIAKGTSVLDQPVPSEVAAPGPPLSTAPPPMEPAPEPAPSAAENWLAQQVDAEELVRWGKRAAREGDLLVAHRLFARALEVDPDNEDAWLWRAGTTDQPREAVRCLEQVLRINPFNERAHRGLSEATRRLRGA